MGLDQPISMWDRDLLTEVTSGATAQIWQLKWAVGTSPNTQFHGYPPCPGPWQYRTQDLMEPPTLQPLPSSTVGELL